MTTGLFPLEDAYVGDPLLPDMDHPTPPEVVASLTPAQRKQRVHLLTDQARRIAADGTNYYRRGRKIAARCILLSGGDDSTAIAHLFRESATHIVHVNTGTGVPETTEYVRSLAKLWGIQLIEATPPDSYEDLVLGRVKTKAGEDIWPGGFPGPGSHGVMYQRLKERALDKARHQLGIANSRTQCAVWIAGRRREESKRRADIPLHESDGSVIWVSPVANWTKLDLNTYRSMNPDIPRNPVAAQLHMSGECLCGAYAHPGELDELGFFYPAVKARIVALQEQVKAAGYVEPHCVWGHGQGGKVSKPGRLCTSCDARFEIPPA